LPTPPVKKNEYDDLWEKWQNDYMKKKIKNFKNGIKRIV